MTGLHTGHCPIRANREIQPEGQKPLPAETFSVAQLLKSQGYSTAAIGKWGMGMFDNWPGYDAGEIVAGLREMAVFLFND